jgi:hypothetical protein
LLSRDWFNGVTVHFVCRFTLVNRNVAACGVPFQLGGREQIHRYAHRWPPPFFFPSSPFLARCSHFNWSFLSQGTAAAGQPGFCNSAAPAAV